MTDWCDFTKEAVDGKVYFREDRMEEICKAVQREFERLGLSATVEVDRRKLVIEDGDGPQKWANGFKLILVWALSKSEALTRSKGRDKGQYLIEFFKYQDRSAAGYHDRLDQVWSMLTLVERIS